MPPGKELVTILEEEEAREGKKVSERLMKGEEGGRVAS